MLYPVLSFSIATRYRGGSHTLLVPRPDVAHPCAPRKTFTSISPEMKKPTKRLNRNPSAGKPERQRRSAINCRESY